MSRLLFAKTITTTCHEYTDGRKNFRVILTVDLLESFRKENANTLSVYGFGLQGWQLAHTEQVKIFELTEAISRTFLNKIIEEKSL